MAENDIYNSKLKYENFKKNLKEILLPPEQRSKYRFKSKYYCKNPKNLEYFSILFNKVESRDLSYVRRNRLISERIAKEVKEKLSNNPKFSEFFSDDIYLVPVPKSSLIKPGMLWVSKRLAEEFSKLKMGIVFDCLERKTPVPASHLLKPKDRLKPKDHYNSINIKSSLQEPKKIVLIDDVLTRGATLLGCASRLKEVFPNASIKAFVAIQTISYPKNFKAVGEITLMSDGNSSTNR